ncbi:MAG: response regulator [Desulfobacteraceae bacterium]|nr:MAG: response regulator [Desulfobacteraceae bacterium]
MTKNRIKILIVDDEEGILDVTESYFQRKGYEVYTAPNGVEAMDVISQVDIGCCFTDINMPRMDGLELAERIREKDSTLPVVVMTGFPSLENSIQTIKNGVVDYLIKPVNLEQMELTLTRILRERELFVENLILKEEVERQERLKKLNRELIERIDEVNTLNRVMEDFENSDSIYNIFNKVVELGLDVLKSDQVFFHIYPESDQSLIHVASQHKQGEPVIDSMAFSPDVPDQVKAFIMDVIEKDNQPCLVSRESSRQDLPDGIVSFMVSPLKIKEKTFGVASAFIFQGERSFSEKEIYYMSFITQKAASAIENIILYENISENLFGTLYAFVAALEVRDAYTRQHSTRVAKVADLIGRAMGCSEEELNVIDVAGRLHDIGKIGIRDEILLKPGRLTKEEYEKIKEHPAIGADIVGKLGLWDKEQVIIRHHHERYDGKGYPDGLAGDKIPRLARILSVADAFDAMASDRAYREKMEISKVVNVIRQCSGTQFDPEVVEAFLSTVDEISLADF